MELQSQDNPARQVAKAYDDIKEIDYLDISKVRKLTIASFGFPGHEAVV